MGIMSTFFGAIARQMDLPEFMCIPSRRAGGHHLCRTVGKGKSLSRRQGKGFASQKARASRRRAKQKGLKG